MTTPHGRSPSRPVTTTAWTCLVAMIRATASIVASGGQVITPARIASATVACSKDGVR